MKTKSNMTVSKLQSEAVKMIVKILTMEPIYIKKGLPKEAIEELKLVHQRDCLVELFSDKIEKAYYMGKLDYNEKMKTKPEGVFKKMGLDEKFMEFLEDTGVKFITTNGNRHRKNK